MKKAKCNLLLIFFIIHVALNLSYLFWLGTIADRISLAWIYVFPLLAFFYVFFSLVAVLELYRETQLGLSIAFCIILFETILEIMLYEFISSSSLICRLSLVFFIILNSAIALVLVYYRDEFQNK